MKNTTMRALLLVLLSAASTLPICSQKTMPPEPINTSMIQLIATPERFDGKLISVVGFLGLDSEETRLYVSEHDYQVYIPSNGVWINQTKQMEKDREQIDLHYVTVVGIFKQRGLPQHMAVGDGDYGITDIRQCLPWLTPAERHPRKPR